MATICETAGEAGRYAVLSTHRMMEFFKMTAAATGGAIVSVARQAMGTLQRATSRWPRVCGEDARPRTEPLAELLDRKKEILARLGQEKLSQADRSEPSVTLDPGEKSLLDEAHRCEKEILTIREEQTRRRQDKEFERTTRRAVSDLKSPDAGKRRVAVRVLERVATSDAIPELTAVLGDADPEVSARAAQTIERLVHEAQRPGEPQ